MSKSKFIVILVVVSVLISLSFYVLSYSENFKVFTRTLDEFGTRASSTNFLKRIGSGGQGAVVGISEGTNFHALQGYVYNAAFVHADANADGNVGLPDLVYLIKYVLQSGPEPIPLETGDVNCDKAVDLVDIAYLQSYLFQSGPPPCNL